MKWNDGPEFIHELTDPWAPHPVVNRHVCYGGGGATAADPPDYTNFNANTMGVANTLQGYGKDLYGWAQGAGQKLSTLADTVSSKAGDFANWATDQAQGAQSTWNQLYGPLVSQQVANAQQFSKDLPATQEQWAGAYSADAATKNDQAKASLVRQMEGEGLTRPGIAQQAIDTAAGAQRALAVTSAGQAGRVAAAQRSDQLTAAAEGAVMPYAQQEQGMAGQGAQYANIQMGAPSQAISTTAGAYSPYISSYGAAAPYQNASLTAMQDTYQNQLGQFNANQQASSNSPMSTIVPLAAGIAGSIMAPGLGTLAAGGLSAMAPSMMAAGASALGSARGRAATGGMVPQSFAVGGMPMAGRSVPPTLSPSGGAQTDDVTAVVDGDPRNKAAINTGEFIMPKDATAWYGEKFMQNLVAKAAKERHQQTVAAPTAGPPPGAPPPGMPPGAISTQPPMAGAPA